MKKKERHKGTTDHIIITIHPEQEIPQSSAKTNGINNFLSFVVYTCFLNSL